MEETPDRTGNSGMLGLKVVFFFPSLPEEDIIKVVVDFFLFKRGGEAGKKGFSANEKKAWRKIWCGFFFRCGCNGHGALGSYPSLADIPCSSLDMPANMPKCLRTVTP